MSFILWEENSFISKDISHSLNSFNYQNEINLHNLNFMRDIYLDISFLYQDKIHLYSILVSLVLIITSLICRLNLPMNLRYMLLDKKNSIYLLIYPLNLLFSYLMIYLNIIPNGTLIINLELTESFLYVLLGIDILEKYLLFNK